MSEVKRDYTLGGACRLWDGKVDMSWWSSHYPPGLRALVSRLLRRIVNGD